jgi:hypothetical protein
MQIFKFEAAPAAKMRSAKAPLFGELADRLSMFLIRSDRARAGNNQAGFIACGGIVVAKKMIRAAHAKEKQ